MSFITDTRKYMEDRKNISTTELAATDTLTAFANLDELQTFGERIAKSGLTPLKEGKDIVAAVLYGREIGLSPMVSVNNIYPINGKGTLSVHIINALLQRSGVVVEVIRNYEPCVPIALKGEDGKAIIFDTNGKEIQRDEKGQIPKDDKGNPLGKPFILREGFVDETLKDHEVRSNQIINYKTVLRFTRQLKQPFGPPRDQIIESSYSIAEARQAGLADKDNWKNYAKQMTLNRALAFGGRLIAADILMGMYETSELADATNTPYKVVDADNGKIEIQIPIKKEGEKSSNTDSIPLAEEIKDQKSL